MAPGAAAELGGGGGAAGFVCSELVHGAPTPKAIVAAFPGIEETRRLAPSISPTLLIEDITDNQESGHYVSSIMSQSGN